MQYQFLAGKLTARIIVFELEHLNLLLASVSKFNQGVLGFVCPRTPWFNVKDVGRITCFMNVSAPFSFPWRCETAYLIARIICHLFIY